MCFENWESDVDTMVIKENDALWEEVIEKWSSFIRTDKNILKEGSSYDK